MAKRHPKPRSGPNFDDDRSLQERSARRICSHCNLEFPLIDPYWHKDKSDPEGFQRTCRQCRSQQAQQERNEKVVSYVQQLSDRGIAILEKQLVDNVIEAVPHTVTILEDLMYCFGGSDGYARHLFADYLICKPGSANRLRYHSLIVKMIENVSNSGLARPKYENMSKDELELNIEQQVKAIVQQALARAAPVVQDQTDTMSS